MRRALWGIPALNPSRNISEVCPVELVRDIDGGLLTVHNRFDGEAKQQHTARSRDDRAARHQGFSCRSASTCCGRAALRHQAEHAAGNPISCAPARKPSQWCSTLSVQWQGQRSGGHYYTPRATCMSAEPPLLAPGASKHGFHSRWAPSGITGGYAAESIKGQRTQWADRLARFSREPICQQTSVTSDSECHLRLDSRRRM